MSISDQIVRLRGSHSIKPRALPSDVVDVEHRFGVRLPPDMKEFYGLTNGADLRFNEDGDIDFRILPLQNICQLKHATDPLLHHVLVFSEYGDGDRLAVILSETVEWGHVIDFSHDVYPTLDSAVYVEASFTAFLQRLLDEEGDLFWLLDMDMEYGE